MVLILLIGGVFFVWQKKSGIVNQSKTEDPQIIQTEKPLSEKEKAEKYAETWNGDTSQWKLYQNKEAGIEITYPEEVFSPWEIKLDNMSVDPDSGPGEFHFELRQKGYSIDDYKHKIWVSLNSIRSEKEYSSEKEKDTVVVEVPFGKKTAKIFTTKKGASTSESKYKDFLVKGICDPESFTIVFDERDNGEFRSYAHVGCEGRPMGKIYQAVFHSISFLNK